MFLLIIVLQIVDYQAYVQHAQTPKVANRYFDKKIFFKTFRSVCFTK